MRKTGVIRGVRWWVRPGDGPLQGFTAYAEREGEWVRAGWASSPGSAIRIAREQAAKFAAANKEGTA